MVERTQTLNREPCLNREDVFKLIYVFHTFYVQTSCFTVHAGAHGPLHLRFPAKRQF